jgi:SET domain-containing protein
VPNKSSLLEDLLAGKQGLGSEYKFEPDTLEVKPNRHGISGVFTRHALAEGTEIISIPVVNGSLTPFRSYEEAQELLQKLGSDRFNVSHEFAIACAMYLRSLDASKSESDVLITEKDMKSSYFGSPMVSYGSLARAKLLSSNNRLDIEYAVGMDELIRRLDVDADLFRALFGYISSRSWKGVGVIPVLDWFNASYANGANCDFSMGDGKFAYVAIRDVAAGEELVWNYNNANAVTTWFNYGYVDNERPTLAFLEVRISEEDRIALESFAIKKLNFARNKINSNLKIDKCLFQRELLTPNTLSDLVDAQRSMASYVTNFVNVRAWFRMLILSGEKEAGGPISYANMSSDEAVFGLDIERKVIGSMRAALANGFEKNLERIEQFSKSEIGRSIDMAPYVDMITNANRAWEEALAVVEDICSLRSREECVALINASLGLDIESPDEIRPALDRIDSERPSLTASLIRKYAPMLP